MLTARADSNDFIREFASGNLNILGSDGSIETAGHNVRITRSSNFASPGDVTTDGLGGSVLNKTGLGQLTIESTVGDGFLSVHAIAGVLDFESNQTLDALVILTEVRPRRSPSFHPCRRHLMLVCLRGFRRRSRRETVGQAVPEPGSAALLLSGLASLLGLRRRRA